MALITPPIVNESRVGPVTRLLPTSASRQRDTSHRDRVKQMDLLQLGADAAAARPPPAPGNRPSARRHRRRDDRAMSCGENPP